MNNYYTHTIKPRNFDVTSLAKLEDILKSGYLLSRRKLGLDSKEDCFYNGLDYISLCDMEKNNRGYSSYNMYLRQGLSLLIDHSIEVITPVLIERDSTYSNIHDLDLINHRYTDFKDEVQVKDSISLKYLRGLCFPVSLFLVTNDRNQLNIYVNSLYELLNKYHYNAPVYNLDSEELIKVKK